jgi:hypothetical protein
MGAGIGPTKHQKPSLGILPNRSAFDKRKVLEVIVFINEISGYRYQYPLIDTHH